MLTSMFFIVRELLARKPWIGGAAAGSVMLLALALVIPTLVPSCDSVPVPGTRPYFTTDDGATRFTADATVIPPFTVDGKEAVQAVVYTCDEGKTQFIAYLVKYDVLARANIDKGASKGVLSGSQLAARLPTGRLIKKPGDAAWLSMSDGPKYQTVATPKCPDGQTTPELYLGR